MRPWQVNTLLVALASPVAGCGESDLNHLEWRIVFDSEADRQRAVVVEASIHRGDCGGVAGAERLYRAEVRQTMGGAVEPPALSAGRYAFVARAGDRDCVWYAEGCTPFDTGNRAGAVVVRLEGVPTTSACSPAACVDGSCSGTSDLDAGTPGDAGTGRDSSRSPDAATDPPDGGDGGRVSGCAPGALPLSFLPSNLSDCSGLGDELTRIHEFRTGRFYLDTDTGEMWGEGGGDWVTIRPPGEGVSALIGCSTPPCGNVGYYERPPLAAGGVPLGVFVFGGLELYEPTTLIAGGNRALVLVGLDLLQVDGALLASGSGLGEAPGGAAAPPGGELSPGARAGSGSAGDGGEGGGGGGFGSAGGAGGPAVAGGGTYGTARLVPLIGGSAGGDAAGGGSVARGGAGGGAVQLVSGIRILIGGRVDVSGGGGGGGVENQTGGGGGGSGGAILLEAPEVSLASGAVLRAAGGGGGSGAAPSSDGIGGEQGSVSACPVPGGPAPADESGAGGDGSCGATAGGPGEAGALSGGGGGGAGRIRINHGGTLAGAGAAVPDPDSPLYSTGDLAR